jgi:hypothetical protein
MEAKQVMQQVLYLPVYPGVSTNDLKRLARATTNFEAFEEDAFINR